MNDGENGFSEPGNSVDGALSIADGSISSSPGSGDHPFQHDGVPRNSANGHLTVEQPPSGGKKKLNPLADLIETERLYVDLLASIIRRVAAAWSRTNFPPPQLDMVFRSVETVYKSNKGLLAVRSHHRYCRLLPKFTSQSHARN
jgi:hypothetical protein